MDAGDKARSVEHIDTLLDRAGTRIERIVSPPGYAEAPDAWCDQPNAEWVTLLAGAAALQFEGEAIPRCLTLGDYMLIPARRRHRVAWTDSKTGAVWLAVHLGPDEGN